MECGHNYNESHSFCAPLHSKVLLDDRPATNQAASPYTTAPVSQNATRLEPAPPCFPSEHACAYARTTLTNQCSRRRLVNRRGGAAFYTSARSGGPSSFSLNAANMVSIAVAASGCGGHAAPPSPRRGKEGVGRCPAGLR